MTTFLVCKASPAGGEPVASATLEIAFPFDEAVGPVEDTESAARSAEQMSADAELVHTALLQLPQGTLDRLLILMLEREATLLRVQVGDARPRGLDV